MKAQGFIFFLKNFPARPPIVSLCDAKDELLLATQGAKWIQADIPAEVGRFYV